MLLVKERVGPVRPLIHLKPAILIVQYLTFVMVPGVCRGHPERSMEVHRRTILEPGHRSPDNLC